MRKALLWLFIMVAALALSFNIITSDYDADEIPELTEQRAEELIRATYDLLKVFFATTDNDMI